MIIATVRRLMHSKKLLHSTQNAFNIRTKTFHNSLQERVVFLSNTPFHYEKRSLLAIMQPEFRINDYRLICESIRYFSTTNNNKNQTELKSKPQAENIRDLHNNKKNESQSEPQEPSAKVQTQDQKDQDERIGVKTEPEEKLSLTAKFKKMWKDYWYVLLPVHLVTSSIWLGGFYYLSTSGVDIPALLETMHFSETMISKLKDSSMGHVAIAYMCYKIVTPLRYTVTLGGTTLSIKYLSQLGYIRPVPSKERLKEMYREAKKNV